MPANTDPSRTIETPREQAALPRQNITQENLPIGQPAKAELLQEQIAAPADSPSLKVEQPLAQGEKAEGQTKTLAALKIAGKSLEDTGQFFLDSGINRIVAEVNSGRLPRQLYDQIIGNAETQRIYRAVDAAEKKIASFKPGQISAEAMKDCVKTYNNCADYMNKAVKAMEEAVKSQRLPAPVVDSKN